MPSPTEITVAQLSRLIGIPGAPVLADVRTEEEFNLPDGGTHALALFRDTLLPLPWSKGG